MTFKTCLLRPFGILVSKWTLSRRHWCLRITIFLNNYRNSENWLSVYRSVYNYVLGETYINHRLILYCKIEEILFKQSYLMERPYLFRNLLYIEMIWNLIFMLNYKSQYLVHASWQAQHRLGIYWVSFQIYFLHFYL